MIVTVDTASPIPPFEQVRAQIAAMVESGALAPGARLPPIRQLAKDLGLAPGTIARAYSELERSGSVAARGRHGTVVTAAPTAAAAPPDRRGLLDRAAAAFAAEARRLGADPDEALHAARAALARQG